jgi:tetratricopeptide (TPR) repeat protein
MNIFIGLVIGALAVYCLVVPAAVTNANNEANQRFTELSNDMNAKTVAITGLEADKNLLEQEVGRLREELEGYAGVNGTLETVDSLLESASIYLETGDLLKTEEGLDIIRETVVIEEMTPAYQRLYQGLVAAIGPALSLSYYREGHDVYYQSEKDYGLALRKFEKAVFYDPKNVDAIYYLANCYRRLGEGDKAIELYTIITTKYPGSLRAADSKRFIEEINND